MSNQVQRYQQGRPPAPQEPKKFQVVVPEVPGIPPEVASQIITGFRSEDGTVRAYVLEAGLHLKLEQIAKKKGGLRLKVVVPISFSYEDPERVLDVFGRMPEQAKDRFLQQRDYEMAMFTTPIGTALFKGVLLFGDGTKIWDYGVANRENVKMSTLHGHLDQLAATRALLRAIRRATARGFLTADQVSSNQEAIDELAEACEDESLLQAELDAAREGDASAGDAGLPFRVEDEGAPEPAAVEPGGGGGEAQPVAGPAPTGPGPARPGPARAGEQVAGTVRAQSGTGKLSKIQQAYVDAIYEEGRKHDLSEHHLAAIVAEALGRSVRLAELPGLTPMELATVHQAVVGRSEQGDA